MPDSEELREVRREVEALRKRLAQLSLRLTALESRPPEAPPEAPPPTEPPPIPVSETPPIAPKRPKPARIRAVPEALPIPDRGSGPFALVREAMERVAAKTREEGWETLVGTYLLPRVGIFVVTTAVVFLLYLAIERWGPPVRVAIGYGVCVALLGLGWRLEKQYAAFARVLYSGGFALSYFVTYATHYVPFARVIDNQTITLALLTAVVVAWAAVAQVRQSRTMAVLVTFLGHYTIFLSGPGPYSICGILLLSAGSAFFLLRNRWYYVAVLGIVGAYVNHMLWMEANAGRDLPIDFWISMGFLTGYLLIFALAELFSPEDLRRKRIPTWFRSGFVTLNTAGFLILGTILVHNFEFTRPHQDLFRFASAAALILIALGYLLRRKADPLYNVYFIKGVAVFTLGLAARYSGNSLSAWLAVEMVVLLVSARRSGLLVTRLLAFGVGCLAFAHGVFTVLLNAPVAYTDPTFRMEAVQAVLAILAFLVASQLYQRTDWTPRTPSSGPFSATALFGLWCLDLVAECPPGFRHRGKPVGGLLFPYIYALGGAVLFLFYTTDLVAERHDVLALSVTALALTCAGALLTSKPYGLASLILIPVMVIQWTLDYVVGMELAAPLTIVSLVALGGVALCSEAPLLGRREGLAFHQAPAAPHFLYGAVVLILGLFLVDELSVFNGAAALALSAVVVAGLFTLLHPRAMAYASAVLILWGEVHGFSGDLSPLKETARGQALAWGLILLPLCLDRYYRWNWARKRAKVAKLDIILVASSWVFLTFYQIPDRALPDWAPVWWAVSSFALMAYGLGFRSKPGVFFALAGALIASIMLILFSYDSTMAVPPLIAGYSSLALFWIVCERLYAWATSHFDIKGKLSPVPYFVTLATILLVLLLERVPRLSDYYLTVGWTLLAGALFALALALHQKHYRYAGLIVFLLALGRAFVVDMRDLEGLYRVGAFAVLGTVLLVVGLGYAAARTRFLPKGGQSPNEDGMAHGEANEPPS